MQMNRRVMLAAVVGLAAALPLVTGCGGGDTSPRPSVGRGRNGGDPAAKTDDGKTDKKTEVKKTDGETPAEKKTGKTEAM